MKKLRLLSLIMAVVLMVSMLAGCKSKDEEPEQSLSPTPTENVETIDVTMTEIVDTLRDTYGEDWLLDVELDESTFNTVFGIPEEEVQDYYEECFGELPIMSVQADRLFIAKTQDTEKMKQIFTDYMNAQIEDTLQYPMNSIKVNNYCLTVKGDYVILFILGGHPDIAEEDEAKAEALEREYYVEQNEKGLKALDNLFKNGYTEPKPTVVEGVAEGIVDSVENVVDTINEELANVEPTEEPIVEFVDEPTEEPVVEPTESVAEPTVEPIVEPTVEPVEEPSVAEFD